MTDLHPFVSALDGATLAPSAAGETALRDSPVQWLPVLEALPAGPCQLSTHPPPDAGFTGPQWPHFFATYTAQADVCTPWVLGRLNADLDWLTGHFPGQPVLPGVVQTHWAGLLGQHLLPIGGTFSGLSVVKFQQVMEPGRAFALRLNYREDAQALKFEYHGSGGFFSQGRINFGGTSVLSD